MPLTEEMKKYYRDWYSKQSDEQKRRKQDLQNKRRQENVLWVRKYKELFGCPCGEKDWRCLDFHHLRDKEKNVADMTGLSKENLFKEMAKCIILCSNCHRKETFGNSDNGNLRPSDG